MLPTPTPPRPSVLPGLAALGWMLLTVMSSVVLAMVAMAMTGRPLSADPPPEAMLISLAWCGFVGGAGAYGLAVLGGRPREELAPGRIERWLAVGAGLLANLAIIRIFSSVRHSAEDLQNASTLDHFAMTSSGAGFALLLAITLLGSVAYEFLLRGFALRRFSARWSFPLALALVSCFDGVVTFDGAQFIPGAALSVVAGLVAWRTRSTWGAVIVMAVPELVDQLALRAGNLFGRSDGRLAGFVVMSAIYWLIRDVRIANHEQAAAQRAAAAAQTPASGDARRTR